MYMHACMYVCMYVCIYVYIDIHTFIHTHTHTHTAREGGSKVGVQQEYKYIYFSKAGVKQLHI
jgi:hypothetical protein